MPAGASADALAASLDSCLSLRGVSGDVAGARRVGPEEPLEDVLADVVDRTPGVEDHRDPGGQQPADVVEERRGHGAGGRVRDGSVDVEEDPERESGRVLVLDGLRHSYVDLDDPTHLEFAYVQAIASAVAAYAVHDVVARASGARSALVAASAVHLAQRSAAGPLRV